MMTLKLIRKVEIFLLTLVLDFKETILEKLICQIFRVKVTLFNLGKH